MEIENPLVSIIVITYNSSKYVLETLESAKAQTYQNIELIVSDDCSSDNTIELCEKWLEENKDRFIDVHFVRSNFNTGIPANVNRGIDKTKGKWIKLIAGDDILHYQAISNFINYSKQNSDAVIINSVSQLFKNSFSKNNFRKAIRGNKTFNNRNINATQQYNILLFKCVVHAPNVIFRRDVLYVIGDFDERYKFMEDYPYWLKVTRHGYKFNFLDLTTVFYRIHNKSVYNNNSGNKIFNDFYILKRPFEKEYIYPYINFFEKQLYEFEFLRKKMIDFCGLNRRCKPFIFIYIISSILSPFNLYTQLKIKKINIDIKNKCSLK